MWHLTWVRRARLLSSPVVCVAYRVRAVCCSVLQCVAVCCLCCVLSLCLNSASLRQCMSHVVCDARDTWRKCSVLDSIRHLWFVTHTKWSPHIVHVSCSPWHLTWVLRARFLSWPVVRDSHRVRDSQLCAPYSACLVECVTHVTSDVSAPRVYAGKECAQDAAAQAAAPARGLLPYAPRGETPAQVIKSSSNHSREAAARCKYMCIYIFMYVCICIFTNVYLYTCVCMCYMYLYTPRRSFCVSNKVMQVITSISCFAMYIYIHTCVYLEVH